MWLQIKKNNTAYVLAVGSIGESTNDDYEGTAEDNREGKSREELSFRTLSLVMNLKAEDVPLEKKERRPKEVGKVPQIGEKEYPVGT